MYGVGRGRGHNLELFSSSQSFPLIFLVLGRTVSEIKIYIRIYRRIDGPAFIEPAVDADEEYI